MPIRGQSRRAQSLGPDDPRARRAAQGALSEDITTAEPVGIDATGRISLVQSGAMLGDAMRWDGRKWVPHPVFKPTPLKTSNYTAKGAEVVLCDPTAGGFSVTLPPASLTVGLPIIVKNHSDDVNNITIVPTGQDLIDDDTSAVIAAARASLLFIPSAGYGWIIA